MRNNRTTYLWAIILWGSLVAPLGNAWAAPSSCTYAASGSGIGGTGITGNKMSGTGTGGTGTGGTGTGGTGILARGSGMGGTGITPSVEMVELQLAGNVIASTGHVEAQSNGRSRILVKGGAVCVGETIVTSVAGSLQIRMIDDASIAIRPQTQLKIDKYAYSGTDKDASLITLFKGASRFVTGRLGKKNPQNDLVETPTATIGVLGTDHEAKVVLPGEGGAYPAGTYDKVNQGITFIRTEKGRVDIHPNQVGLAASTGEMPTLLKDIPDFYNAEPSIKEGGGLSEEGHKNEGLGESNKEDKSMEHSGEINNADKPSETGLPSNEPHESHHGIEVPETPAQPELPELHEQPELPELPELPSIPEVPEPQGPQE